MISLKTIGQKIKDFREDADMTQEELAKKTHRSLRAIKYYEKDERLTIEALTSIADALNVSLAALVLNTNDLFKLFIYSNNLNNLAHDEAKNLKSDFEKLINNLILKYKKD